MSSSILYKFKSGTTFEALPLPGTAAKLLDVKKAIVKAKKLDQGSMDFDISVQDATSGVSYSDDAQILPRGTRIVVQRLAAPKGQGILAKIARSEYGLSSGPNHAAAAVHSDFYTIDGSKQHDDDEEFVNTEEQELAALRAATDTGVSTARMMRTNVRPVAGSGQPPMRHHSNFPPKFHHNSRPNADPELREHEQMQQPKKRATGIPRTFLSLAAPHGDGSADAGNLIQPNTIGFEELVQRAGGQSEIATGTKRDLDYAIKLTATTIPEYLQCAICNGVVRDAMMLPWDLEGRTTCESCIRTALTENGFRCPLTQQEGVSPDDLLPNLALRKAAKQFIKEVMEKVEEIDKQANVDETIQDEASGDAKTSALTEDGTEKGVVLTRRSSTAKKEDDPFGDSGDVFGGDVFATSAPKKEEEPAVDEKLAAVKSEELQASVKEDLVTASKSEPEPTGSTPPIKQENATDASPHSENANVKQEPDPTLDKVLSASKRDSNGRRRGPPVGYTMGPAGGMATDDRSSARVYSPRDNGSTKDDSPFQDRRPYDDRRLPPREEQRRRSEERRPEDRRRSEERSSREEDRRRDESVRQTDDDWRRRDDRSPRDYNRRRSDDTSPREYEQRPSGAPKNDRLGNGSRDDYDRRDERRRKRSRSPSEQDDDRRHRDGGRWGGGRDRRDDGKGRGRDEGRGRFRGRGGGYRGGRRRR